MAVDSGARCTTRLFLPLGALHATWEQKMQSSHFLIQGHVSPRQSLNSRSISNTSHFLWASPVAQKGRRHKFDPWVRKIPWRKTWQPTPVFLPGKSHGQRSLAGYRSWGHKELYTTERACRCRFPDGPCGRCTASQVPVISLSPSRHWLGRHLVLI